METCTYQRCLPYALIALGLALAFISAVVPHFTAGHRVMAGVLLAGILPYLGYGLALPLLRSTLITVAGIILVGLHTSLVLTERFSGAVDYSDGLIYYGPLALALATLPLLVIGLSRPWGATPSPEQPDDRA